MLRDGQGITEVAMKPIYLSIMQQETGKQIQRLLSENGYTVRDVQTAMGFDIG